MIPVDAPIFSGEEKKYVDECISTCMAGASGSFVSRLEKAAADYCGRKHAIAVSSGTAALETALYASGVRPGQRVIMPTFAAAANALAAIRLGATPVLVDSDPATGAIDAEQAARLLDRGDESTRTVLAVHTHGHPANLDPILAAAAKQRATLIEGAAAAIGAEYASHYLSVSDAPIWKRCGSFGKISALSLRAGTITAGEGGMILTDSDEAAECARGYCDFGGLTESGRIAAAGYNFRMANLSAALGLAQWEQLDVLIARKRQIGVWYGERLQDMKELRLAAVMPWAHPVYAEIAVELTPGSSRNAAAVMADLRTHQIATRPFFPGLHARPAFRYLVETAEGGCPHADTLSEYGFCLPAGPMLTEAQVHTICEVLKNIVCK